MINIMWYAMNLNNGIVAEASTKKEVLSEIVDMNTRCKRLNKGAYVYEQQDESELSCWHEIAYIFGSEKIAIDNGFGWAFQKALAEM